MKMIRMFGVTLLAVAAIALPLAVSAAPVTVDGTVSDSMCVKKHMMPGKSDAKCIEECIKSGSKYVLVAGTKVYTLNGNAQTLASFAGKHVLVQGEVKGDLLSVQSIRAGAGK